MICSLCAGRHETPSCILAERMEAEKARFWKSPPGGDVVDMLVWASQHRKSVYSVAVATTGT